MPKRLQVILDDEAWKVVESVCSEANEGFELGNINYSDTINELILCSKPDVKQLQLKHMNIRKSLKLMASQESIDLDSAIKFLSDLRSKTSKRQSRLQMDQGDTG